MRCLIGSLVVASALVAPTASPGQTVAEQRRVDLPERNMNCPDKSKAGVFACRFPGNFYGVSAYTDKKRPTAADMRVLERQALVRAAQMTLENDRDYFSGFNMGASYAEGDVTRVAGMAGYQLPDSCLLKDGVPTACSPGQKVAAKPGYSVQGRGYDGMSRFVSIFMATEKASIDAGTYEEPPTGAMNDAEAVYARFAPTTPGRWPSLIRIYEDRAGRLDKQLRRDGRSATPARSAAIRTWMRLGLLYTQAGQAEKGLAAVARSGALARGE